ncbi:polysaccharide lyase 6 family protein [Paenibacillus sp. UMB4589-SE434]|uniref:polysaccharide lyase 6 family protein n=1 Tax=Paenibacillus sp. UMB4589-SE434 TaxID=3046314 RepID=UPI00254F1005|nr:polysaccharide lyase 6 family protein [Paenibacillus sp. UMB4589-SE434]MDK8180141.1 polysaccharide lyase 6 family protein [Paenibacillus sp. UMB4589-SE434]
MLIKPSKVRRLLLMTLLSVTLFPVTGYSSAENQLAGGAPGVTDVVYDVALESGVVSKVVKVSTSAQLETAIDEANPGTTIVLANGTYTGSKALQISGKHGTSTNPITIKAANRGRAIIAGADVLHIVRSSHIVVEGLKITNTGTTTRSAAVQLDGSNHIRLTRNMFAVPATGNKMIWLEIKGENSSDNQIDRNDFNGKSDPAPVIAFSGYINGAVKQISQRDVIEYNHFRNVKLSAANGNETIRLGVSKISLSEGQNKVQYNLFENCDGDLEVVSVKSGNNEVRYNTFINNRGGLTARHGHNNKFYGNFFFGDGVKEKVMGIRIYGNDHKIYNNYMEDITGDAIFLDSGKYDGGKDGKPTNPSDEDLSSQWRVYRATVVNNTIVNSKDGITIGSTNTSKKYAPTGSWVANNIVANKTGILYHESSSTDTIFKGNLGFGSTLSNASRGPSEILAINPDFTISEGLHKLSANSPAINKAVTDIQLEKRVKVIDDMDGQLRSKTDVGADEFSNAASSRKPLKAADVGPNAPE